MKVEKDYLREVQKFVTSQYWNSGIRITAGVMVPLFVLVQKGWLSAGIPFLWGALFVSLTDTPGPIHHRRNGMIAAIVLNAVVVLITAWTKEFHALLVIQIVVGAFFLSMAGIYGGRAGAVGSLALVIMLLSLLSTGNDQGMLTNSLLVAAGGTWYMIFSLLLYRLMPYRIVEQALGENLIAIADYIRARAAFYKDGANLQSCFNQVMEAQHMVQKIQAQTQELLFKTRRFVADASPKSRSSMMIYLDSLDLFEETMYSYQDYELLHKTLGHTSLLNKFYGLILQLAAELEHVGISVQSGLVVKRNIDLTKRLGALQDLVRAHHVDSAGIEGGLQTLEKTLQNIQYIINRINKVVLYTRLKTDAPTQPEVAQKINSLAVSQPITWKLLRENLTLKSNTFRHALRLTTAMIAAYGVALLFSLHHAYWVLLTVVTIMKPVYSVTRKRNIARVTGTLVGVLLVSLILYFLSDANMLLAILVISMLIGYSLLQVNYFGFVVFLTVFVVISFYFLNPFEFKSLIRERLIDTIIGSAIAFLGSRYVFPVWGHEEIRESMQKMLAANGQYFYWAWRALKNGETETAAYESARQDAVVALTNLSDNFQRMLDEPQQSSQSQSIHQFVIASHMLTSHIAALSSENIKEGYGDADGLEAIAEAVQQELKSAEAHLENKQQDSALRTAPATPLANQSLSQLAMILTLARDIRKVTGAV